MSPVSQVTSCPVCSKTVSSMSKHLTRAHAVQNPDERKILVNLAAGRVNVRGMECPVDGCMYSLTRLDKHIVQAHAELSVEETAQMLVRLKWDKTVQLLQELGATQPSPPLTRCLQRSECDRSGPVDDEHPPPSTSDDEVPGTSSPRSVAGVGDGEASPAAFPSSLGKASAQTFTMSLVLAL